MNTKIKKGDTVIVYKQPNNVSWNDMGYHQVGWVGIYQGDNNIIWKNGCKYRDAIGNTCVIDGEHLYSCDRTILKLLVPKKRITPFTYWYLTTTKK